MASSQQLIILLCIVAILLPRISAVKYTVGEDRGWTIGVNYTAWAEGNKFRVNDELVFNYPAEVHNVVQVNGMGFEGCDLSVYKEIKEHTVSLDAKGTIWFICTIGNHCKLGQKLKITVS